MGPKALAHAAVADDKLALEIENAAMAVREEYPIRFNDFVWLDLWRQFKTRHRKANGREIGGVAFDHADSPVFKSG
jgi:hypothetical protein